MEHLKSEQNNIYVPFPLFAAQTLTACPVIKYVQHQTNTLKHRAYLQNLRLVRLIMT